MRIQILFNRVNKVKLIRNASSYVQGQEPETGIREYFYYIDHQGMVRTKRNCVNILKLVIFR